MLRIAQNDSINYHASVKTSDQLCTIVQRFVQVAGEGTLTQNAGSSGQGWHTPYLCQELLKCVIIFVGVRFI